jgi:hypothetical protein
MLDRANDANLDDDEDGETFSLICSRGSRSNRG